MKKTKTNKYKRIIRNFQKKILTPTKLFFINHVRGIVYFLLFLFSLIMMSLIFFIPEDWDNAIAISCGIGSGAFTSLLVSLILNAENNAREKRKLQNEKEFLFNKIIMSSLDVYGEVIYRINEYITLSEIDVNCIYGLYEDFKPFNAFADYLKTLNTNDFTEKENSRLEKLFNFRSYRIDYLVSNLKHLPRQEYYLHGLLSQEEYSSLVGDTANDTYLNFVEHISDFWDDEILDLSKCIQFLRMTIYITCKTISTFEYAIHKAKNVDDNIKDDIDRLYFDEVYSKSEEYVMSQINAEIDKLNYYAEHPEEFEILYDLTEEDFALEELSGCIFGFSENTVESILDKLDKNSEKVKAYFNSQVVRDSLKKKWKIKLIIKAKYGKNYLKEISKLEEQNNG